MWSVGCAAMKEKKKKKEKTTAKRGSLSDLLTIRASKKEAPSNEKTQQQQQEETDTVEHNKWTPLDSVTATSLLPGDLVEALWQRESKGIALSSGDMDLPLKKGARMLKRRLIL